MRRASVTRTLYHGLSAQTEAPEQRKQVRSIHPGATRGFRRVAVAFGNQLPEVSALELLNRTRAGISVAQPKRWLGARRSTRTRRSRQRNVAHRNRAFDQVPQFPHVSSPVLSAERGQHRAIERIRRSGPGKLFRDIASEL